jgi:arginase family enzyme
VFDAGDIVPGAEIATTHSRLSEAAVALLDMGLIPVAVGGGHDLTLGLVRGVAQRLGTLAGVYFDAHLDVRPEMGSGTAFRRLVEEGCVDELHLRGMNWASNSSEHLRWFVGHGGRLEGFASDGRWPARDMFVSCDLDVLDAAFAPGVSALNPCGWTPQEACRWVLEAGRQPRVRCFDIMELSPPYDDQGRTALLAAHLFLTFLRGVAERR